MCGEYIVGLIALIAALGSSPRVRGIYLLTRNYIIPLSQFALVCFDRSQR